MAGKAEIVEKIADSVEGTSRRQAAAVYDAVVAAVAGALRKTREADALRHFSKTYSQR